MREIEQYIDQESGTGHKEINRVGKKKTLLNKIRHRGVRTNEVKREQFDHVDSLCLKYGSCSMAVLSFNADFALRYIYLLNCVKYRHLL